MNAPERKLGRYELLRRLASGGMGEIYLARARGAGGFEKLVIIKTILPHLAEEEEFVTKFLDEGRIVVQLTHGNIVPVFDMGEEAGEYFIAMEYVPGLDMRAILKRLSTREEHLPVEIALYIACEVCKGLGYAHRKVDSQGSPLSIVHRDVSPSNVLISREGEVKIIDFGIARAAGKLSQTATGSIQGKCCYMSPEQARGKALDARSDIFSAGVLLYEMLTLTRPFEGRSDLESLELVRNCQADPPGVLRPEISEEIDDIVGRAMALDPDERYQSIDDFYIDLQHELYRLGHTVTSQRLVESLSEVFDDDAAEEPFGGKPANLDEALELELARLDGDSEPQSSKPEQKLGFATTAAATPEHTRTMAPTPASPTDPPVQAAEDGPHSEPTGGSGPTPLDLPNPSRKMPLENDEGDDDAPGDTDEEPRRHFWPLLVAMILLVATAGAVIIVFSPTKEGTLRLATDPSGARILLDGEELPGQLTPQTLTLPPGNYHVELALDGYRSRQTRVELAAGDIIDLDADDLRLSPEPRPPRTFTIDTDPADAVLSADGEPLEGRPAQIAIEPGEVVNLAAHATDCSPVFYTISYGHQRDHIELPLQCRIEETPEEVEIIEQQDEAPRATAESALSGNRLRRILIESRPTGAEIVVDEEVIGHAPVYAELREDRQAVIEARHPHFQTHRTTTRVRDITGNRLELAMQERPRGCLTFRAVYPANNEIAINGRWLDGRHSALQSHPLPEGDHTITVRHPESSREESFDVFIEAGSNCRVLTVWENNER